MAVLKVKHVTMEAVWAPVAPYPVIPPLCSPVKGILTLLSASNQQNCHKMGEEFAEQKPPEPPNSHCK